MLGLVDLVVVGDAMVRVLRIPAARLRSACATRSDRHAARAREAAGFVRDGVDSPMESRLRLLIVLSGLPEPVVDHHLCDAEGRVLRRLDLSYPELRLAIEYDGRHHAEVVRQWEADLDRREELEHDGWRIIVVTASGIYREPSRTLDRIRRAIASRGGRDLPWSEAWRPHFPGR
jgi:hypothetical protein